MTRHRSYASLVAALLGTALMLAHSGTALAADAATASLVFKAGLSVSETLTPGNADCNAVGVITGSGQASHLGMVTLSSYDCIVFTSPTAFRFSTLTGTKVVLTSATGDQLFATYSGTGTPQPGDVLGLLGSFVFKGGTGRFVNAKGLGIIDGVERTGTNPAVGVLVLTGVISF